MGTYLLQIVETISLGRLILVAWFQLMLETDLKVIVEQVRASFSSPDGVTVDDHNNVFVSDRSNKKIRMISSSGEVYTIAGSGDYGDLNGSGDNASFGFTANIY